MRKTKALVVQITEEQEKALISLARSDGFRTKSEFIRTRLFKDVIFDSSVQKAPVDCSFELLRGERRSFFCPNELWKQLTLKIKDTVSISQYIRFSIEEKLERDL